MDIVAVSNDVQEVLQDELEQELLAVGWYDGDKANRTGVTYLSDRFKQAIDDEQNPAEVLDTALLDRLGPRTHEVMDEEKLAATAKFYESFIDVHIHVAELQGVVVAVQRDGDVTLRNVVSIVNDNRRIGFRG
jgi:hypothetical protein